MKAVLFWNNRSVSQPLQLTAEQVSAVQQGLEIAFPGRKVIFDPDNRKFNSFRNTGEIQ
jgi:hypothetical protein